MKRALLPVVLLPVVIAALLLAACDDSTHDAHAAGPVLAVSGSPGQIDFRWATVDGASFYRLYRRTGLLSPFVLVEDNITATHTSLAIAPHDIDWTNTVYRIDACRGTQCVSSATVPAALAMTGTIRPLHAPVADPDARFGYQLALSADGNTLAVTRRADGTSDAIASDCGGAGLNCLEDSGAVDVFVRSAGQWQFQATLRAPTPGEGDWFGEALAISADGNTLAIGALGDDSAAAGVTAGASTSPDNCNGIAPAAPCAGESGAVFVFTRAGSTWSIQATLKAAAPEAGDIFGDELALSADGNRLLVGAMNKTNSLAIAEGGMVFLFDRSGVTWSQTAGFDDSDATDWHLGAMLAMSGDGQRIALTGYSADDTIGYVTLLHLDNGTGTVEGFFTYTGLSAGSNTLVPALDGDGSVMVVGVPNWGGAGIYRRTGSSWDFTQTIEPAFTAGFTGFGRAVAITPDASSIVVGAYLESSSASGISSDPDASAYSCDPVNHPDCALGAGAVHLFRFNGTDWRDPVYVKAPETELFHDSSVTAENAPSADYFGMSVAISADGSVLVAGAPLDDSGETGTGPAWDDGCEAAVPFRCARSAGSVFIY